MIIIKTLSGIFPDASAVSERQLPGTNANRLLAWIAYAVGSTATIAFLATGEYMAS